MPSKYKEAVTVHLPDGKGVQVSWGSDDGNGFVLKKIVAGSDKVTLTWKEFLGTRRKEQVYSGMPYEFLEYYDDAPSKRKPGKGKSTKG